MVEVGMGQNQCLQPIDAPGAKRADDLFPSLPVLTQLLLIDRVELEPRRF